MIDSFSDRTYRLHQEGPLYSRSSRSEFRGPRLSTVLLGGAAAGIMIGVGLVAAKISTEQDHKVTYSVKPNTEPSEIILNSREEIFRSTFLPAERNPKKQVEAWLYALTEKTSIQSAQLNDCSDVETPLGDRIVRGLVLFPDPQSGNNLRSADQLDVTRKAPKGIPLKTTYTLEISNNSSTNRFAVNPTPANGPIYDSNTDLRVMFIDTRTGESIMRFANLKQEQEQDCKKVELNYPKS